MVKFTLTGDDGKVRIGIGLTRQNLLYLQQGKFATVDVAEMTGGRPVHELLVFFGETEQEITEKFVAQGLIGPETRVHADPRLKPH